MNGFSPGRDGPSPAGRNKCCLFNEGPLKQLCGSTINLHVNMIIAAVRDKHAFTRCAVYHSVCRKDMSTAGFC